MRTAKEWAKLYSLDNNESMIDRQDFLAAVNNVQTEAYNQALKDFSDKLIVSAKFSEVDKKLECWSNKDELLKILKK